MVKIDSVIKEASGAAAQYGLELLEIDRTDSIISLKLVIDNDLFIKIYGNVDKNKLNLALVFKTKRLYGYDSEGGKPHMHPFDNPDDHIFTDRPLSVQEFVSDSLRFLEEREIL